MAAREGEVAMARRLIVGLFLWSIGCGGGAPEAEGRQALLAFGASEQTEEPGGTEVTARMDSVVPERIWDGLLGLAFIGVLWGLGALIHGAIPGFRHYLPPALGIAIVVVFLMPTAFFQFKGVQVDPEGVTVETQTGGASRILFQDVERVLVTARPWYPRFTDARELVLEGPGGQRVGIPFFVPRREAVARAVLAGLRDRGNGKALR